MSTVIHLNLSGKTRNLMSEVGMAQTAHKDPQIGMGATICMHSDRHAGTVIGIDQPKKMVIIQRDKAKRTDNWGMSDSQEYSYTPDSEGATYIFKFGKDNRWHEYLTNRETFRLNKVKGGCGLILGDRDEHYDFSH
jgi:hypothetical protein